MFYWGKNQTIENHGFCSWVWPNIVAKSLEEEWPFRGIKLFCIWLVFWTIFYFLDWVSSLLFQLFAFPSTGRNTNYSFCSFGLGLIFLPTNITCVYNWNHLILFFCFLSSLENDLVLFDILISIVWWFSEVENISIFILRFSVVCNIMVWNVMWWFSVVYNFMFWYCIW